MRVLGTDSGPFERRRIRRDFVAATGDPKPTSGESRGNTGLSSMPSDAAQRHERGPRRRSRCVAAVGSTSEAQDVHTARRGRARLRPLRSGMSPARGRAQLRTRRLDRRGIVRSTRGSRVLRRRGSIEPASLCRRSRHAAPSRLVRGDPLELRATISCRLASRAVPRRRSPHAQCSHAGEAYLARCRPVRRQRLRSTTSSKR
jgi:hypothetical protein